MEPVDVVAVVGSCAPERSRFARELARCTGRMLVPAQRVGLCPDPVTEAVSFVPWCTRGAGALVEFPEHTDDKLAAGPAAWSQFHDPFPARPTADRAD